MGLLKFEKADTYLNPAKELEPKWVLQLYLSFEMSMTFFITKLLSALSEELYCFNVLIFYTLPAAPMSVAISD